MVSSRWINRIGWLSWFLAIGGGVSASVVGTGAIAQTQVDTDDERSPEEQLFFRLRDDVPSRYNPPSDPNRLTFEEDRGQNWDVVTEDDPSLYGLTPPSLWLHREQIYRRWGGYRLVRGWTAFYSQSGDTYIIDILVDPQYWNRLDYAERYAILTRFGTTGMSYGYQVRLYSSISLVGIHACDFSAEPGLAGYPRDDVPIPEIENVQCSGGIGPFIDFEALDAEDLFDLP